MIISNFRIKRKIIGNTITYSAFFSFEKKAELNKEIWFCINQNNSVKKNFPYESFLIAAYPMALELDEDVHIDAPIDNKLKTNLYKSNLYLGYSNVPKIYCKSCVANNDFRQGKSVLFVTLGLDSLYSLLKYNNKIDYLLFIEGYDVLLDSKHTLKNIRNKINIIAKHFNKKSIFVSTNLRWDLSEKFMPWIYFHGAALAASAYTIGVAKNFSISSSDQYLDNRPWGTGSIIDMLWSNNDVFFNSIDKKMNRIEKIKDIVKNKEYWSIIDNNLRVCWQNFGKNIDINCGTCEKCIRTYMELKILGYGGTLKTLNKVNLDYLSCIKIHKNKIIVWKAILDEIIKTKNREFYKYIDFINIFIKNAID